MAEYKMDAAHGPLALDRGVQDVLGKAVDRIDGPLKVTGQARYGYEHRVPEDVAFGYLITAPVAKGRVDGSTPTPRGRCRRDRGDRRRSPHRRARPAPFGLPSQGSDAIDHYDQVIGVAVAESWRRRARRRSWFGSR